MAEIPNYFEIGTPDPEEARHFYGSLFDWTFDDPSPLGYGMVNGGKGGLWDTTSTGGSSWAIFYVQVDDVKAAIARALSLGASVALPYVDNGSIEFAHLLDPRGNRFGVWRPKQSD
ncbi:VOC family protein [Paeniglutamicibacter sp. NPDC012692]|uniref:VOC family protein n=1 Tax=Paeniglutamicibacter sp. NPDC012692 TaxID=3364388 RepID=UPI0036BC50CF